MKSWLRGGLFILLAMVACAGRAAAVDTEPLVTDLLAKVRAEGCTPPAGVLSRILCAGTVRVGVRADYKSFGVRTNGVYHGFEIDLARLIAERLGVRLELVGVTPANRVPKVMNGDVDLVIATMGHTVDRDRQIDFVRPHYYASPTAVVGPKSMTLAGIDDLAGRTVCVPIGNFSNVVLSQHHARLMIFDGPEHLVDALRLHICSLIAHDRALLVADVTGPEADPAFADQYEEKIAFSSIPWGIGIAEGRTTSLNKLLGWLTADLHASGKLVALAKLHHVDDQFLRQQQRLWSGPDCLLADGSFAAKCLLNAVDIGETPTEMAPTVMAFQQWFNARTGWQVSFPMFTGVDSFELFINGIVNSLILVAGGIAATFGFALLLQYGLRSALGIVRIPTRLLVTILQCSPVILLLVLAYLVVTQLLDFSTPVALSTAIVTIGLGNGSYAASAITEAAGSMQPGAPLAAVLRRASTQIMSFLVNAARASAIASFIGAPELLAALTDITSYTSERRTTYTLLLVFYMAVVMAVVAITRVITRRLELNGAAAS